MDSPTWNSAVLEGEVLVSVVVVPREGFRQAPSCLTRLLEVTNTPFHLIYVDGNSPGWIARRIQKLLRRHGGTLIRSETYLRPTQARNVGAREVNTRYIVFLDNDVRVMPGWLDSLVQAAERTGAAYVSPIICIGGRTPPLVHVAGGVNELVEEDDGLHFRELSHHAGRRLPDVLAEVTAGPTTMAEFHAVLVRMEVLMRLGGLDEACSTAFEHNDLCLQVASQGGLGWLEPASVVDYAPAAAAAPGNASFHLVRWSAAWIDESLRAFCGKWSLPEDDAALAVDLASLHQRRRRPLSYVRSLVRRLLGKRAVERLDRLMDWCAGRLFREDLARGDRAVHVSRWAGSGL